jgi:hypothetical protein
MLKNGMFKNGLLKWMPHKEQNVYERKLIKVMKRLEIESYHFNWDRDSCFIEFHYHENSYRLEHSIKNAKKRGIILNNGLDCLMELTVSLEDLYGIMNRGIGKFETWISGMKQTSSDQEIPEFEEEFHISYKSLGNQSHSDFNRGEYNPFTPESSPRDYDQNGLIQRPRRR